MNVSQNTKLGKFFENDRKKQIIFDCVQVVLDRNRGKVNSLVSDKDAEKKLLEVSKNEL